MTSLAGLVLAWLALQRGGFSTKRSLAAALRKIAPPSPPELQSTLDALMRDALVEARRGGVGLTRLGRAALVRWATGEPVKRAAAKRPAPKAASPTVSSDAELAPFAARVREAAKRSPTGRFGSKVFIAHVWRALERDGDLDERSFKERLVEAHRAQLLELSRADLVEAMDATDVRASETSWFGATFHFVRL